jgi:hypothetical protein
MPSGNLTEPRRWNAPRAGRTGKRAFGRTATARKHACRPPLRSLTRIHTSRSIRAGVQLVAVHALHRASLRPGPRSPDHAPPGRRAPGGRRRRPAPARRAAAGPRRGAQGRPRRAAGAEARGAGRRAAGVAGVAAAAHRGVGRGGRRRAVRLDDAAGVQGGGERTHLHWVPRRACGGALQHTCLFVPRLLQGLALGAPCAMRTMRCAAGMQGIAACCTTASLPHPRAPATTPRQLRDFASGDDATEFWMDLNPVAYGLRMLARLDEPAALTSALVGGASGSAAMACACDAIWRWGRAPARAGPLTGTRQVVGSSEGAMPSASGHQLRPGHNPANRLLAPPPHPPRRAPAVPPRLRTCRCGPRSTPSSKTGARWPPLTGRPTAPRSPKPPPPMRPPLLPREAGSCVELPRCCGVIARVRTRLGNCNLRRSTKPPTLPARHSSSGGEDAVRSGHGVSGRARGSSQEKGGGTTHGRGRRQCVLARVIVARVHKGHQARACGQRERATCGEASRPAVGVPAAASVVHCGGARERAAPRKQASEWGWSRGPPVGVRGRQGGCRHVAVRGGDYGGWGDQGVR